jgi:hydroxymethylbilane synthase
MTRLRIATRGSDLALWQANHVAGLLQSDVELVLVETSGDRDQLEPIWSMGGKGVFVKEVQAAVLDGRADIAVHSMKDVPMEVPREFSLVTFGEREQPADAFVSNRHASMAALPAGAVVGTSSLRRECQLRSRYPGLELRPLRGNVNTRLAKLDAGDYDAIILAVAGLKRLGFEGRIRDRMGEMVPAIAQGILAIEFRRERDDLAKLFAAFEHAPTACAARAERALGLVVEGSCEVPVGALATVRGDELRLDAFIGMPDGTRIVRESASGRCADAQSIGERLGERLLAAGGREILRQLSKVAS